MIEKAKMKEFGLAIRTVQFGSAKYGYEGDVFLDTTVIVENMLKELLLVNGIVCEGIPDILHRFEELRRNDDLLKKYIKDKIFRITKEVMLDRHGRLNVVEDEDSISATSFKSMSSGKDLISATYIYKGIKKWNKKQI